MKESVELLEKAYLEIVNSKDISEETKKAILGIVRDRIYGLQRELGTIDENIEFYKK